MICFFIAVVAIVSLTVWVLGVLMDEFFDGAASYVAVCDKLPAFPYIFSAVSLFVFMRALTWAAEQASAGG